MRMRTLSATVVLMLFAAAPARAEWFVKGFGGLTFARDSGIIDLDQTNSALKPTFGAAVGRGSRSLQIETEIAVSPRFFRGTSALLDTGSVTTLTANAAWTFAGSSSRVNAYVIGGAGLMRIALADKLNAFTGRSNKFVANVGAGVGARIRPRLNGFAEVRYFRSTESSPSAISFGSEYLSYARFALGARLRF